MNCRLTGITPGGSERYEVWNIIPARRQRAFALLQHICLIISSELMMSVNQSMIQY